MIAKLYHEPQKNATGNLRAAVWEFQTLLNCLWYNKFHVVLIAEHGD